MTIRHIDALTSSTLKHLRERWWGPEFTEFLRETLQPRPGDRILDVGCGVGTGEVRLGQLRISQLRLQEATTLLEAGQHAGAYYLAGYPVECALKACIAGQTEPHEFPDRVRAQRANVHDVEQLMEIAQLEADLRDAQARNPALEASWSVIKDWDETSRYERGISGAQAALLVAACSDRTDGLLPWIRSRW